MFKLFAQFPLEDILLLHTKLYFSLLLNLAIARIELSNALIENHFIKHLFKCGLALAYCKKIEDHN